MPKGPKGEKRPADVIGNAVHVMRIATGEVEEQTAPDATKNAAARLGKLGGEARNRNLSQKQKREIAQKAAKVRWKATSGD